MLFRRRGFAGEHFAPGLFPFGAGEMTPHQVDSVLAFSCHEGRDDGEMFLQLPANARAVERLAIFDQPAQLILSRNGLGEEAISDMVAMVSWKYALMSNSSVGPSVR